MNDGKNILREAWDRHEGPLILSTASEQGVPNAIYVTCVKLLDDRRIVVADNYFKKTRANVKRGGRGTILFMTKEKKSYQAKGSIEYLMEGPLYEDMRLWVEQKHPRIAAVVLNVEELYSGAERLI